MTSLLTADKIIARELSGAANWVTSYTTQEYAEAYAARALADMLTSAVSLETTKFGPYRQYYLNVLHYLKVSAKIQGKSLPVDIHRTIPQPTSNQLVETCNLYASVGYCYDTLYNGIDTYIVALSATRLLKPYVPDESTLYQRVAFIARPESLTLALAAPFNKAVDARSKAAISAREVFAREMTASLRWMSWYRDLFREPRARA